MRCGIRKWSTVACDALVCTDVEVPTCHEKKHSSCSGRARTKMLLSTHRNEGYVLQIPFLFWVFLKAFLEGVSKHILISVSQTTEVHVPTGWVIKTTLFLENVVQIPVIFPVQQMRNYSGSSSSSSNRITLLFLLISVAII